MKKIIKRKEKTFKEEKNEIVYILKEKKIKALNPGRGRAQCCWVMVRGKPQCCWVRWEGGPNAVGS